jgi:hypothetical protein
MPPNPKCKHFKGEKEIPNKTNEIANMKMEKKFQSIISTLA